MHHFEWTANVVAEEKGGIGQLRQGKESNERLTGWNEINSQNENSASIRQTAFPPKCHHTLFYPMPSAQKDFLESCCMLTCSEITLGNLLLGALPTAMLLQATLALLTSAQRLGSPPLQGELCEGVGEGTERELHLMVGFFCSFAYGF